MNSHSVTVVGYAVIAIVGCSLEWVARRGGGDGRIPRLSQVLASATRSRAGRVGVIAGWAWLGLHFFAR